MADTREVRLELFGAPRILVGGAEVRLPVRKSLALLAYLACEGKTSRAKLADLFWGETGDDAARRNLRRELHRVREAGLTDLVVADDTFVNLAAGTSDVRAFEALVDANPAAALDLYRGPLLDGFELAEADSFETWLAARRESLARRWSQAAQQEARRLEARGDAASALDLHLRLIEDDPLQETHFADAMRLSYQVGERARALEIFERCRTVLRSELGLDPLPETVALADRIRAADRVAQFATPVAAAGLAHLAAPFVGRTVELRALADCAVPIALIVGEPGVGKSRLARESLRGVDVVVELAGSELGQRAPLHAVVDLLERCISDPAARERLSPLSADDRIELGRVIPTLGSGTEPASGEEPASVRKQRFVRAVATALSSVVGDGALLIDDLHWIDELTLDALEALALSFARRSAPRPRVVITARAHELGDSPAAQLVRRLERGGVLQRFDLARFDSAATRELVQRLSGSETGGVFAQRLQRSTQGNPFFLLETIRFLFDSGELAVDPHGVWTTRYDDATSDYAELPVPPNVHQSIVERVERLGPATRRILETAALAGNTFTLDEVKPATALSDWEALEGLERASGASLLIGDDRHYRFDHDLVRVALDQSLGPERRRLIHRRLADTLIARAGRPGRIASHLSAAGELAAAAPWHVAAAREAERVYAHADALAHYAAALDGTEEAAARVPLHLARVELCRIQLDLASEWMELDRLEQLVDDLHPPTIAAEVLVRRALASNRRYRHADAVAFAQRAQAHAGFKSLSAFLQQETLLAEAFALVELGRYDEARAIYLRELGSSTQHGPGFLGGLHYGMANLLTSISANAEAATHLRASVDFYDRVGDIERRMRSLNILAYALHETGDTPGAIETMDRVLAEARRLQSVSMQRNALLNFVAYLLGAGDVARARELVTEAETVLRFAEDGATRSRLQIRVAEVAVAEGDVGEALTAARKALAAIEENGGGLPDFWPWFLLATLLWRCGDGDAAAAVYRELPRSRAWLPTAATAVEFFPIAFRLPASAAEAVETLPRLQPSPGVMCGSDGIAYYLAFALHALGRNEEALATLAPNGNPIRPSPFMMHRASPLALRIAIDAALGQIDPQSLDSAERLLSIAPPFESIELRAALARVAIVRGDTAAAEAHRGHARTTIARLAQSLSSEPARAESLRRFWEVHLG